MAGSYSHCVDEDGGFTFDLIENLGDAEEACEEMFDMIKYLCDGDTDILAAARADHRAKRKRTGKMIETTSEQIRFITEKLDQLREEGYGPELGLKIINAAMHRQMIEIDQLKLEMEKNK